MTASALNCPSTQQSLQQWDATTNSYAAVVCPNCNQGWAAHETDSAKVRDLPELHILSVNFFCSAVGFLLGWLLPICACAAGFYLLIDKSYLTAVGLLILGSFAGTLAPDIGKRF